MALGHLGDVDVNAIIDDKGKAWPLEWTTRMGWPAENMLIATTQGDPIQWMRDACDGKDTLKVSPKICCGVVVAQPDYPYSEKTKAETTDIPIYGVTKANENYLYPQSVKRGKLPAMDGNKVTDKDMWATTGDYVMVVTGQGKTVRQACTRVYDTLHEIHIPDMIFRDDIGEKLADELPKIQQHGYCTEWVYE
jgi:phosphoribosylamine--glycine ligase